MLAPNDTSLLFRTCVLFAVIIIAAEFGGTSAEVPVWHKVFNDPGAFSNLLVAVFTAVLCAVAFLQTIILFRAERIALRTAEAALKSAKTAEKQLLSISLAEGAVVDVVVDNLELGNLFRVFETYPNSPSMFDYFSKVSVDFYVKNYGRSAVRISAVSATLMLSKGSPLYKENDKTKIMFDGILPKYFEIKETYLPPGGSTPLMEIDRDFAIDHQAVENLQKRRSTIWFHGSVCYIDIFKFKHKIDFFWKYDRRNKIIIQVFE